MQNKPLRIDPYTGQAMSSAMMADDAREQNPSAAWLFDPWSGRRRTAGDVFTDPMGMLIVPVDPIDPPAEIGGMSMFATEADYWRHMSEHLANELTTVAVALGVSRTEDIARQIARIRGANDLAEATRLIDSMNAGSTVIETGSLLHQAKQMDATAKAMELDLIQQKLVEKLGTLPDDWMDRGTVQDLPPYRQVSFDGEPLVLMLPPRLELQESATGDDSVYATLTLEHVEPGQKAVEPDAKESTEG